MIRDFKTKKAYARWRKNNLKTRALKKPNQISSIELSQHPRSVQARVTHLQPHLPKTRARRLEITA